ncbi:MAG: glucosaminidase domain-containing protein [Rhodospirillales bacterium]|nr:glucosaminidase domain-containing protein [Rhodospirillales bacterium]
MHRIALSGVAVLAALLVPFEARTTSVGGAAHDRAAADGAAHGATIRPVPSEIRLPVETRSTTPVPGAVSETGALAVDAALTQAGLTVDAVREGDSLVPRVYVAAMPRDMAEIGQAADRKRIFIKVMLPLVLDANERILADRARLLHLKDRVDMGRVPSAEEQAWIDELAALYYVDDGDLHELARRVDAIPASLALAQSALESGWGTSRFVHEGNAVFGQRSWNADDGIVPGARPPGETHVVKSFDGLKDSVFAYLVNLNRHPAYEHLRAMRVGLHARGETLDGWTLAGGLDEYAEAPGYVDLIRSVIRQNDLTDFDSARLADLAI